MGTLNQNQFKKSVIPGQMDLNSGGLNSNFTVRIDPDSAETDIQAGVGLKLVDGGANDPGGVPLVDILGADTELAFGASVYDLKNGLLQPGEIIQVSYRGGVQFMTAKAALARGVAVSLELATPGNVQALGSNAQFGITLDKAVSAGDIIRILVDPVAAST